MSRLRLNLSDADAQRLREIVGAAPRSWHDRLWDWTPRLLVAGLIWLGLLTVAVGWLFWREATR